MAYEWPTIAKMMGMDYSELYDFVDGAPKPERPAEETVLRRARVRLQELSKKMREELREADPKLADEYENLLGKVADLINKAEIKKDQS